jgi:DNA-binding response OmpR family regulator
MADGAVAAKESSMNKTAARSTLAVLRDRLQRIQALHARCVDLIVQEVQAQRHRAGAGRAANLLGTDLTSTSSQGDQPVVDPGRMAVLWRGERCLLRYSYSYDLAERLFRNPHRWLPFDRLAEDIWNEQNVNDGAVAAAIKRLRRKLEEHGMGALATMIVVSGYRCGYFPDGQPV